MFSVTPEIYSQLATQIESAVENKEFWGMDYKDPDSVRDTAEAEAGDFLCSLDFTAYPRYSYEEINPGIYGPDGQWGWVRDDDLSLDCDKFTVTDEDGNELESDFSADELKKYLN